MKNISKPHGIRSTAIVTSILIAGVFGLSNQALAASQCKGLDNSACGAAASCGWVEGYERKDGRKVSSFCRTKSGFKAKQPIVNKAALKNKAPVSKVKD